MPQVRLPDRVGNGASWPATVEVQGNPAAWVFTEAARGQISLNICGDCGFAEMNVHNYRELYEKYLQQQKN
jgi:hypothetical protein